LHAKGLLELSGFTYVGIAIPLAQPFHFRSKTAFFRWRRYCFRPVDAEISSKQHNRQKRNVCFYQLSKIDTLHPVAEIQQKRNPPDSWCVIFTGE
jgi:hypothetical protein